jgi:hypothetical protein
MVAHVHILAQALQIVLYLVWTLHSRDLPMFILQLFASNLLCLECFSAKLMDQFDSVGKWMETPALQIRPPLTSSLFHSFVAVM